MINIYLISKTLVEKLKKGIVEVSKSTKLIIGVMTNMAARMNTILLTVIFNYLIVSCS